MTLGTFRNIELEVTSGITFASELLIKGFKCERYEDSEE